MKTLSLCLLLALIAGQAARAVADEPLAGRIVDLTHAYDGDTVYWPTADGFELKVDFKGMTDGGWYYEANTFRTAEHGGTHLDAPIHFAAGRHHADEIPLEKLIGPAVVIDVTAQAAEDRERPEADLPERRGEAPAEADGSVSRSRPPRAASAETKAPERPRIESPGRSRSWSASIKRRERTAVSRRPIIASERSPGLPSSASRWRCWSTT